VLLKVKATHNDVDETMATRNVVKRTMLSEDCCHRELIGGARNAGGVMILIYCCIGRLCHDLHSAMSKLGRWLVLPSRSLVFSLSRSARERDSSRYRQRRNGQVPWNLERRDDGRWERKPSARKRPGTKKQRDQQGSLLLAMCTAPRGGISPTTVLLQVGAGEMTKAGKQPILNQSRLPF